MLSDLESKQIERTISTLDKDKFAQAICAFSNDLSNTGSNGYLLIKEDNTITTKQLALRLGITEKGVEYHLRKLKPVKNQYKSNIKSYKNKAFEGRQ